MSLSKLIITASLFVSPVAFAKNTPSTPPRNVSAPSGGYQGVGSNPKDSSDDKYENGKGSNQEVHPVNDGYSGKGSNPSDKPTSYVPDNEYHNDTYYYDANGYVPPTDISGQKKVKKDRNPVEVGLRYSIGKGLDVSPDLAGLGLYARAFSSDKRYAVEASLDALGSDPTVSNMRQGSLLLGYVLFLNPDGKLKPYGSAGLGGTWHGVAGNQNIFGALSLGVGLDVAIRSYVSFNLDSRVIIDSEASPESANPGGGTVISASTLNSSQEFVVSSAGVSLHF
jgi:hypothetical protein